MVGDRGAVEVRLTDDEERGGEIGLLVEALLEELDGDFDLLVDEDGKADLSDEVDVCEQDTVEDEEQARVPL